MTARNKTLATVLLSASVLGGCVYDFEQYKVEGENIAYDRPRSQQPNNTANNTSDLPTVNSNNPTNDMMLDMGNKDVITMPDMPKMDMPGMDTSQDATNDMPVIDMPTNDMPSTDMPASDMPTNDMPVIDMPTNDMPSTDMSKMDMPPNMCGNGMKDPGEECDGADCPTMCNDNDACTMDVLMGSAQMCSAVCDHSQRITACGPADGCCPGNGCTENMDSDCAIDCTEPSSWPAAWNMLESQLLPLINAKRTAGTACGNTMHPPRPLLTMRPKLVEASRCHAHDMSTNNWLGIFSPPPEMKGVSHRVMEAGYIGWNGLSINVSDADTPQQVVDTWFATPQICDYFMNMDFNEIGVGYSESNSASGKERWTVILAFKP